MIARMSSRATVLLRHRPSAARIAEIAAAIAEDLDAQPGQPGHKSVGWYISEELPDGYAIHEADQITAMRRDQPGSVYLTVTVLSSLRTG